MIPNIAQLNQTLEEIEIPTNTHKIIVDKDRVSGYTDGLEAMRQAVYLVLSTERYVFPIYSWNYGIELKDLFGRDMGYVIPTLKTRIEEALLQDDRITSVSEFEFTKNGKKLFVTFLVKTTEGEFNAEMEVNV